MATSAEINTALKQHPVTARIFQGCFPADMIPTTLEDFPCAFVVNTDVSTMPGRHWVAFYAKDDSSLEMFDSFGHPPSKYPQFKYFTDLFAVVEFNGNRMQEHWSSACGLYCMVYILFRCKGFSLVDFVQLFTRDYRNNDQVITGFVNRTWKFNKAVYSNKQRFQVSKRFLPDT